MALEIRQSGGARTLHGRFNYGSMATVRDRGRVRKERFESRAFRYAIELEPERRIDILVGHDFGKPIASRQSGTLTLEDGAEAVTFEARLPDDPPSWVIDAERAIAAGLMTGLSPGFTIPPTSAVPDAVLREFSVITSAAYQDATVDLRAEDFNLVPAVRRRRVWL